MATSRTTALSEVYEAHTDVVYMANVDEIPRPVAPTNGLTLTR
jgi:hypothetical protein